MPDAERPDAPSWSDCRERLKDEIALGEARVRNRELPRSEFAAAPQDDVEVEDSRSPAAAAPPAKVALNGLQARKHLLRIEVAFDQRDCVGEIASGSAVRPIQDDRRGIEQAEFLIETGDRGFDHARRPSEAAVRAVGADRDRVEVVGCSQAAFVLSGARSAQSKGVSGSG